MSNSGSASSMKVVVTAGYKLSHLSNYFRHIFAPLLSALHFYLRYICKCPFRFILVPFSQSVLSFVSLVSHMSDKNLECVLPTLNHPYYFYTTYMCPKSCYMFSTCFAHVYFIKNENTSS